MTLPFLFLAALTGLTPMFSAPVASAPPSSIGVRQDAAPPPCSPVISWLHDTPLTVARTSSRPLSLFSIVEGRRSSGSCESSIQFTVAYMDANDEVVCSGRVELNIPQQQAVQYTHVEVRPGNVYEFLRWRNDPKSGNQQWSRLICMNPDGRAEVQPGELERVRSLRLHATIHPRYSGLATAELRIVLRP